MGIQYSAIRAALAAARLSCPSMDVAGRGAGRKSLGVALKQGMNALSTMPGSRGIPKAQRIHAYIASGGRGRSGSREALPRSRQECMHAVR